MGSLKTKQEKEKAHSSRPRRRRGSSVARSRPKLKRQIDPLTIDTSQFDLDIYTAAKTRSVSPPSIESSHSVGDLIDLSDASPIPNIPNITSNIYSSPNLQQCDHPSLTNDHNSLGVLHLSQNSSHTNPPPTSSSSHVNIRRNNWVKFE